jgi:hypothetical protein
MAYQLELTLEGNEYVAVGRLPNKTLIQLLEAIDDLALALLARRNPNITSDTLKVALSGLAEGSVRLQFETSHEDEMREAFLSLGQALREDAFDTLPTSAVQALSELQKITRHYDAKAHFATVNGTRQELGTLTPKTHLDVIRNRLTSVDTIYGTVLRVGGEEPPRVRVRLLDDTLITCRITRRDRRDVARQLGARLYDVVAMTGEAKRDSRTLELLDFAVYRVEAFRPTDAQKRLQRLTALLKPHVEALGGVQAYLASTQAQNDESEDV